MRALFDVNALLALIDGEHTQHRSARNWWAENRQFGWASCPLTENGFLRVVSQPRYSNPMSVADAYSLLDAAVQPGEHEFWADDISLMDKSRIERKRVLGPNQITDIYLLGLATRNNGRLVTFDRAISLAAVHGARAQHLVVLS